MSHIYQSFISPGKATGDRSPQTDDPPILNMSDEKTDRCKKGSKAADALLKMWGVGVGVGLGVGELCKYNELQKKCDGALTRKG